MPAEIQFLVIMLKGRLAKMDERGASAVEYGLLVAGIAALIVAAVFVFGNQVQSIFSKTSNCISNKSTATCA